MSKNNLFSNTSSQRYSLALFELSNENKSLDVIEEQSLSILKLIRANKEFDNLIKDLGNKKGFNAVGAAINRSILWQKKWLLF